MREILFRGKRVDDGKWWYGLPCRTLNKDGEDVLNIQCWERDEEGVTGIYDPVDPETIGQYTGLTDKNGTRIFEGDIIHFKAYQGGGFDCPIGTDIYYRVLFGHCNPDMNTLSEYVGFWALGENYDEDDLYEYGNSISYLVNSHGACVIGNIHDNPELLKEREG